LQLWRQRGLDRQAAFVQERLAVFADQLAPDLLGEILGDGHVGGCAAAHHQRLGTRLSGLLGTDHAQARHAPDHPVTPALGGLALADRMIPGRRLGQAGQIGGLGGAQFVQ
jgi:hypothetical protein